MESSCFAAWLVVFAGASLSGCKPPASVDAPDPGAEPSGIAVVVEPPPQPPACTARTPRGALGLIPDASDWIVHVSPREVMSSTLWSVFAPEITQDPDWQDAEGVFMGCGLGFDRVDHVLVGFEISGQFVAAIAAPGIGSPELARCLILAIQARAGDEPIADVVPWVQDPGAGEGGAEGRAAQGQADPSVSIIEFTDGRAYLLDPDLLVIATTGWEAEIAALARCEGEAAVAGESRELLGRIDVNAPLWTVARMLPELGTAEFEAALSLQPGSIRDVALSVRLDDGFEALGYVRTREESSASALADTLRTFQSMMASFAEPPFVPILNRVGIESQGTDVLLRASASATELGALVKAR